MIAKSKKVIANELVVSLLTHDDVARLLVTYYGAIKLDETVVDDLQGRLPREYNKENWEEYREDHLRQLLRLLETLSYVSQQTLAKLTVIAATRKPIVVRKVLLELLTLGALAHYGDQPMYDAPEFFITLVKKVGASNSTPAGSEDIVGRMARWLSPLDPLKMALQSGYWKRLPQKIWK